MSASESISISPSISLSFSLFLFFSLSLSLCITLSLSLYDDPALWKKNAIVASPVSHHTAAEDMMVISGM